MLLRRTIILLALVVINVTLFCRMMWGTNGIMAFRSLQAQYSALEREADELDKTNVALSREIRLLQSDNAYVEKVIRQRLHYVRDNEVLYVFTDAPASVQTGDDPDERKD